MQGNNTEKLIATLATPFQSLELMFQQLLTERSIDTAAGAQLDVIGKIVGEPRNGLDDTTYRRYCRVRISANKSNGVVENLITIAKLIVYSDSAKYTLSQEGPATLRLRVDQIAVTDALAATLNKFVNVAKSAGVRVIVQWSVSLPANTFRLDSGPGWDVGRLASSLD